MGGFGSECDLAKAGITTACDDSLTDEERVKYVAENGYLGGDLEGAEKEVRNDKKAVPVDFLPTRNWVFTVLNQQGKPEITSDNSVIQQKEERIAKRAEMETDPEYIETMQRISALMR